MAVSFVQFYDDLKPKASIANKGPSVDVNDDANSINPTIIGDQDDEDTAIGSESIYLEFLNGSLRGQRIMVFKDTTIGRSSENDIALSEKTISASHCRIKVVNDEFVIEDLNSTNGTFIDGQKISKDKLEQGNELQLSSIKIKVH
jgi:pSer/pThr/pTyr-binding forkhead associated (FHA) protein